MVGLIGIGHQHLSTTYNIEENNTEWLKDKINSIYCNCAIDGHIPYRESIP